MSLGFINSSTAAVRVRFPPSCGMHSPPSPPRVAAQEAAQSSHSAGSGISVARPGLIVGCFDKWSSVCSDFSTQVQNRCFQLRRIPNPISPGFSQFRRKKNKNKTPLRRLNPQGSTYGLFISNITTQIKMIFSGLQLFFLHRSACIR